MGRRGDGTGIGLGQEMSYCTLVVRGWIKGDMYHGCETDNLEGVSSGNKRKAGVETLRRAKKVKFTPKNTPLLGRAIR